MSALPSPTPLPSTTSALESLLSTIANSFIASDDPMERYLTAAELDLSNSDTLTLPQVIENIRPSVSKSIAQNAVVLVIPKLNESDEVRVGEPDSFAAAAIWFTPTHPRGPRAITPESTRPFVEYDQQSRAIKSRVLGVRKYYYIHIIVRAARDSTPGAVSSLITWGIERAKDERIPVYLEATNGHARRVYEHFGFRVCGEIIVGVGEVDERGLWVHQDGKHEGRAVGVKCWCMVMEPDGRV